MSERGYTTEELAALVRECLQKRRRGEKLTGREELILAYEVYGFSCGTCGGGAGDMKESPIYWRAT